MNHYTTNPFKITSAVLTTVLMLASLIVEAQDVHFTQWPNATQLFNPGLTGDIDPTIRATLLHKKQWGSLGSGYSTSGLDGQYKIPSYYSDNGMGVGLMVYQDNTGKAGMKTLSIMGSGAYHLKLTRKNFISAGLSLGYIQRSINISGLAWDAQYNGISYDPSLDDKERLLTNKDGNLDVGLGINWKHKGRKKYNLGYAVQHTKQQITFMSRGNDKLGFRQTWHGSYTSRYEFFGVRYDVLVQRQSGAMEIVGGITFDSQVGQDSRYTTNKTSNGVKGGVYYRYKDAVHPFIGFEFRHFLAASFGFDIRTTKMPTVSTLVGGPEISLSYLGTFDSRRKRLIK